MEKQIKVLMVDDEERFRKTTSMLLTKKGFKTTIAESGEKAIEILKETLHDVVILDIKMPGMDGMEALSIIKTLAPETKVIMLTGHGTPDSANTSLINDAFDYLSKPCDIDIISGKIKDAYAAKIHGTPRREKTARDIMIHVEDYTKLFEEDSVKDAIQKLMASFKGFVSSNRLMETGHRSLLVFNREETVTGIISIMDLIQAIRPDYLSSPKPSMADSMQYSSFFWSGLFTSQTKRIADVSVKTIMSDSPPDVDENTNLMEIADLMYTTQLRRIIVSSNGNVIGIVREQELFFEMANIIL